MCAWLHLFLACLRSFFSAPKSTQCMLHVSEVISENSYSIMYSLGIFADFYFSILILRNQGYINSLLLKTNQDVWDKLGLSPCALITFGLHIRCTFLYFASIVSICNFPPTCTLWDLKKAKINVCMLGFAFCGLSQEYFLSLKEHPVCA